MRSPLSTRFSALLLLCGCASSPIPEPSSLDLYPPKRALSAQAGQSVQLSFTLHNTSSQPLPYTLSSDASWMKPVDTAGVSAPKTGHTVQVTVTCPTEAGSYQGRLEAATNAVKDGNRTSEVNLECLEGPVQPDFTLNANPLNLSAKAGEAAAGKFTVLNSTSESLELSVKLPKGSNWLQVGAFNPKLEGGALLEVPISALCPVQGGSFQTTLEVSAKNGPTRSLEVSLNCAAPPAPQPQPQPQPQPTVPKGEVNADFGTNGMVRLDFGGNTERARSIWVRNGKIYLAGESNAGGLVIARLNLTGTPDPTFGKAGKKSLNLLDEKHINNVGEVISDDAGIYAFVLAQSQPSIIRLSPDSAEPDLNFGQNGIASLSFESPPLALQVTDQHLYAAGNINNKPSIARLIKQSGELDLTYDALENGKVDGIITFDLQGPGVSALASLDSTSWALTAEALYSSSNSGAVKTTTPLDLESCTPLPGSWTRPYASMFNNAPLFTATCDEDKSSRILRPSQNTFVEFPIDALASGGANKHFWAGSSLYVMGHSSDAATIVRFKSNLTPDASFGNAGSIKLNYSGFKDVAHHAVLYQGTLYVAATVGIGGEMDIAVLALK
ncbi:hypothetical protein HNR42_002650 [Deinobacterium chartae]|uniref:BACON domain-containing protein n=1 Tax=Deinobacterium chartae TaxID=521158 RepID=A0A841I5J9_9DEIO|nr:delta-60 repeat domain-containing protein [Deinobacterium chartae]MBB6099212.1 hypothetical protein [Deinobacterium chartae]